MSAPTSRDFVCGDLKVSIRPTIREMAELAAAAAAEALEKALATRGSAAAILATGNSQLEFLDVLVSGQGTKWNLDWSKITLFHMDEYLGLPATHSASFRLYMKERVESTLKPKAFHYVEGDAMEPLKECERYTELLEAQPSTFAVSASEKTATSLSTIRPWLISKTSASSRS